MLESSFDHWFLIFLCAAGRHSRVGDGDGDGNGDRPGLWFRELETFEGGRGVPAALALASASMPLRGQYKRVGSSNSQINSFDPHARGRESGRRFSHEKHVTRKRGWTNGRVCPTSLANQYTGRLRVKLQEQCLILLSSSSSSSSSRPRRVHCYFGFSSSNRFTKCSFLKLLRRMNQFMFAQILLGVPLHKAMVAYSLYHTLCLSLVDEGISMDGQQSLGDEFTRRNYIYIYNQLTCDCYVI